MPRDETASGPARVETYRGGANLTTPHPDREYEALLVVKVNENWPWIIVPDDGKTFEALGGETLTGYRTAGGGLAEGFVLRPGDRATRVRSDLEHQFCEWRIERGGDARGG